MTECFPTRVLVLDLLQPILLLRPTDKSNTYFLSHERQLAQHTSQSFFNNSF